jgi:hypothetical protein
VDEPQQMGQDMKPLELFENIPDRCWQNEKNELKNKRNPVVKHTTC